MARVLATADIGSNTVHLLVGQTDGASLTRLENRSEWIALGETVARYGMIPPDAEAALVGALKVFKRTARSMGANSLYVFATEAMRAAHNHDQVLERIRDSVDLSVDIISPRREAELSLRGLLLDSPTELDLMIEVGGGSAQVGRVSHGRLIESAGAPIGTGKLVAEAGLRNPCSGHAVRVAEDYIHEYIDHLGLPGRAECAVASGGVVRGIWRALHPDGDRKIHRKEVEYMEWASARQPITRLTKRFGVKGKRAGTLLPGAMVYRILMERFEITELHVSEFGVREGALIEIARGEMQEVLV